MEETVQCLECFVCGTRKEMVDWDARTVHPIGCKHCGAKSDYMELLFRMVLNTGIQKARPHMSSWNC